MINLKQINKDVYIKKLLIIIKFKQNIDNTLKNKEDTKKK